MSSIEFIHNKVEEIIKKYDSRDPFHICRYMNIRIHYKDLGTALKAYYFYQSRIKNIVINSRSGMIVRRILCAHELGPCGTSRKTCHDARISGIRVV